VLLYVRYGTVPASLLRGRFVSGTYTGTFLAKKRSAGDFVALFVNVAPHKTAMVIRRAPQLLFATAYIITAYHAVLQVSSFFLRSKHYATHRSPWMTTWSRFPIFSTTITISVALSAQQNIKNNNTEQNPSMPSSPLNTSPASHPIPHHVAIRTRHIETAIQFYSLLGFEVQHKFRAGPAKAAWLTQQQPPSSSTMRIELIEIPKHVLNEQPGTRKRAIDVLTREELLGYNHLAFDVTHLIRSMNADNMANNSTLTTTSLISCGCNTYGLSNYIEQLNEQSLSTFGKTLRVALQPQQTIVGNEVYELAFIYDADGCLLELLHYQSTLQKEMTYSGWEYPWAAKQQQESGLGDFSFGLNGNSGGDISIDDR